MTAEDPAGPPADGPAGGPGPGPAEPTPAARLREAQPILPVVDLEAALSWYGRLGFALAFRDPSAPDAYAGVRRDGVELHLMRQRPEQMPAPGRIMTRCLVDDPDRLHAEWRTAGVLDDDCRVEDTAWGTREFALCDPDRHGLVFYRDR